MSTSEDINELATALAAAQADMSNATYNRTNPAFKSKYADLAAIRDATLPALNKHGLSLWQGTDIDERGFHLITRLMHKSGQWIESRYPLPIGDKPQVMGSALTYAKRYAWSSACGVTADDDDDAEAASKPKANGNGHRAAAEHIAIAPEMVGILRSAIKEVEADEAAFIKYLKVDRLEALTEADYPRAMAALNAKRARQ